MYVGCLCISRNANVNSNIQTDGYGCANQHAFADQYSHTNSDTHTNKDTHTNLHTH